MKKILFTSFLGPLIVEWSDKGLEKIDIASEFSASDVTPVTEIITHEQKNSQIPAWIHEFIRDFQNYLTTGQGFSKWPKVNDAKWTPFQKEIYLKLFATQPGQTLSYKKLAELCGSPQAARSVGSAMSKNKLPILIPCHRVLPASGKLGRYSGGEGPLSKQKILNFEKNSVHQLGNVPHS